MIQFIVIRIKSPREKSPRIKSLRKNAVERKHVSTRVLNPNASEVSYKPKQRSYRKTWGGGIFRGGVYLEPNILYFKLKTYFLSIKLYTYMYKKIRIMSVFTIIIIIY